MPLHCPFCRPRPSLHAILRRRNETARALTSTASARRTRNARWSCTPSTRKEPSQESRTTADPPPLRLSRTEPRPWQPAGIVVDILRDRRTKGASGAWNSGLDHLLRICGDPRRVFVATLGDDDRWEADHLEQCLTVAERRGLDMVAAPFQRIEENAEPALVIPPPVAPGVKLPCGQSRHSGQQPGLPIERAARSGPVRRIVAELHRPRRVHSHRGAARRPLRDHRSPDGAPFRLPVAASTVHVRVTLAPFRTRRPLRQVPRPHDRSRTCTVPRVCSAAVPVGGIADQADHCASCESRVARIGTATRRTFSASAPPESRG